MHITEHCLGRTFPLTPSATLRAVAHMALTTFIDSWHGTPPFPGASTANIETNGEKGIPCLETPPRPPHQRLDGDQWRLEGRTGGSWTAKGG